MKTSLEDTSHIMEVLFELGWQRTQGALPLVEQRLRDSQQPLRIRVVAALAAWLIAGNLEGLPLLLDALDYHNEDINLLAAQAIGIIGVAALPELERRAETARDSSRLFELIEAIRAGMASTPGAP
jgi:HEAT repeat protein